MKIDYRFLEIYKGPFSQATSYRNVRMDNAISLGTYCSIPSSNQSRLRKYFVCNIVFLILTINDLDYNLIYYINITLIN